MSRFDDARETPLVQHQSSTRQSITFSIDINPTMHYVRFASSESNDGMVTIAQPAPSHLPLTIRHQGTDWLPQLNGRDRSWQANKQVRIG
jgi:hypothetical protein